MRRAKTAPGAKGSDALARVQRNAVSALQAWEEELENQLEAVRSQIAALGGAAPPAAPAAPKRRRRKTTAKRAAPRRTRKAAKKKAVKRVARKKTARKAARKTARKTAKRTRGAGKKQTMAQAIVQLLKDKGRPLRPVDIAKFIQSEKRYKTKSKNVYNAVMTNLVRCKDVKKNRAGLYTLA